MKQKNKMRVLHIGKYYPPAVGGMENFLGDLLPALQTAGIDAAALVHSHPSDQTRPVQKKNCVRIWRAPCFGSLIYAPISPGFPFVLRRVIRLFRPEILHLHMPNTSAFWVLSSIMSGKIPWVIHWHSDVAASKIDSRLNTAYRFYRPLESRLLKKSNVILATSPTYLAASDPLYPWKDKCAVVPLGINSVRLKKASIDMKNRAEKIWGNNKTRVLAIGRLTYYKGHDVLIKAAAIASGVRVVIVGEGARRQYLQGLIDGFGLSGIVNLAGFIKASQVCALLETCDFLCLPSVERTEAFGLVLLEAMRFAKPVVASDIPGSGIGWVIKNNKTGILTTPGDPGDLADALKTMSEKPELRKSMGIAAEEQFANFFKIDKIAQKIAAVYESILTGR